MEQQSGYWEYLKEELEKNERKIEALHEKIYRAIEDGNSQRLIDTLKEEKAWLVKQSENLYRLMSGAQPASQAGSAETSTTQSSGVASLEDLVAHLKETDAFGGKGSKFQREAPRLPLQGRQEDMDWVWEMISQHLRHLKNKLSGREIRKLIHLVVCQGGSGIGKTRFVEELLASIEDRLAAYSGDENVMQAGLGIYIDFANGDAMSPDADSLLTPTCCIGVRILARGAFGVSVAALRSHPAWQPQLEKECNLSVVTRIISEQLRRDKQLPRDAWVLFLLCCDEYQRLLDASVGRSGLPFAAEVTRALASWMAEVATEQKVVGQCLLVGLEVNRSGLDISGVGADYRYLRPLEPEEEVAALTSYFVGLGLYSQSQMVELLALPIIRTQIAMACGLPQVLDFLRAALENKDVRNHIQATVNRDMAMRTAGQSITALVMQSIRRWLNANDVISKLGPSVLLDLLKLGLSGVLVIPSTELGSGTERLDVAEVALRTGIVWAVARGELLSLRCAPLILWHLASALLQQNRPMFEKEEMRLLMHLHAAVPYPFNQALHGESFEDLTLVSEVCRRSLLAEGKTAIWKDSDECYALRDIWPGAVAAENVLDELVKVQPVAIARDIKPIITKSALKPKLQPPTSGELLVLADGQPQPASWLGEGYAVHMDTAAKNTPSADWRVAAPLKGGKQSCSFWQVKFLKGNLTGKDKVVERFKALKAEFARVCPGVEFRMVYVSSSGFADDIRKYAQSAEGEGLILIDGKAAAELCPILPRAAYLFAHADPELEQAAQPRDLMRRMQTPPSRPISSALCTSQPSWGLAARRIPPLLHVSGSWRQRTWQPRLCRSPLSSAYHPITFSG